MDTDRGRENKQSKQLDNLRFTLSRARKSQIYTMTECSIIKMTKLMARELFFKSFACVTSKHNTESFLSCLPAPLTFPCAVIRTVVWHSNQLREWDNQMFWVWEVEGIAGQNRMRMNGLWKYIVQISSTNVWWTMEATISRTSLLYF